LQIECIVTELRASGTTIRDEDLVHVWLLQRRHITPNGVVQSTAQLQLLQYVNRTPLHGRVSNDVNSFGLLKFSAKR
jgi:hypothetical protein